VRGGGGSVGASSGVSIVSVGGGRGISVGSSVCGVQCSIQRRHGFRVGHGAQALRGVGGLVGGSSISTGIAGIAVIAVIGGVSVSIVV